MSQSALIPASPGEAASTAMDAASELDVASPMAPAVMAPAAPPDAAPAPTASAPVPARPLAGNSDNGFELPEISAMTAAQRLRSLNEIGLALSAQRDIQQLLNIILTKSCELMATDGGSLYLVQKEIDSTKTESRSLYFRLAQNDTIKVNTNLTFPVGPSTLAGYAAFTGKQLCIDDVYDLPEDAPYTFSPAFDHEHGYRTKSMLIVPLKNHADDVIGVLQLINRKRRREVLLRDAETVEREVLPFDQELTELAASLASQAAVALENNLLLGEIENLFDSFVMAASSAIEDRDPSTSGHSQRVTILTVGMAEAASEATEGPFAKIHFTSQQIKELRYAGLLHDFGKIGVREAILTKSHKLEPMRFQVVRSRLLLLRQARETEYANRKIAVLQHCQDEQAAAAMQELDTQLQTELAELDNDLAVLTRANDPSETFLPDEEYLRQQEVLKKLATRYYQDHTGAQQPLLVEDELLALSVRKGSLTPDEYAQIQTHAALSFEFLDKIRWTAEFAKIPNIAHCHHEKLNGKGYPRGILAPDIPLTARMMTVADIYDALTAADRPYKRALSIEKALQILQWEARDGGLDQDVLDLFISGEIYKLTEGWHTSRL